MAVWLAGHTAVPCNPQSSVHRVGRARGVAAATQGRGCCSATRCTPSGIDATRQWSMIRESLSRTIGRLARAPRHTHVVLFAGEGRREAAQRALRPRGRACGRLGHIQRREAGALGHTVGNREAAGLAGSPDGPGGDGLQRGVKLLRCGGRGRQSWAGPGPGRGGSAPAHLQPSQVKRRRATAVCNH